MQVMLNNATMLISPSMRVIHPKTLCPLKWETWGNGSRWVARARMMRMKGGRGEEEPRNLRDWSRLTGAGLGAGGGAEVGLGAGAAFVDVFKVATGAGGAALELAGSPC